MKKILALAVAACLMAGTAFAADIVVEAQFDITGKDISKGYLTVKGPTASVEKDTIDAKTGASKLKGTEVWNTYRTGADKKSTMSGGIQSLFKYGISTKDFVVDGFNVKKNADGTILIQYIHRGKAYKMITDKTGKMTLPKGDYKVRTVAVLQNGENVIASVFSPTGKIADVQWDKVWDASIPDTVIGKFKDANGKEVEPKTGPITDDFGASDASWVGVIQVTLNNGVMLLKGELNAPKK